MDLPVFRYHPDPIASGSIVPWDEACPCCGEVRGFAYDGPVYIEGDTPEGLCPWCIADGTAHEEYEATFVDREAFAEGVPPAAAEVICTRTPGFDAWQGEGWPSCCGDAAAFVMPAGLAELRARDRALEGLVLGHIVHEMGISGGAATRLLDRLNRDRGPTLYLFQCLHCGGPRFHIDGP
ncbi:MAG: CbrC family protein [Gemmatimonadales bacterium]|jgi:uncharacterized protein CbrC (UPF0167 family)|nr:CbrC family protein [Gemmatimonadota bacterium]MBK7785216.1 CbrC family protein [Gemmatimonadota bacterium]MBP6668356.1 CbrC family protein [Gemmatimonadales bacterium]MBP9200171.1 CbrC family protein [Gemmatimonadales bacterium]